MDKAFDEYLLEGVASVRSILDIYIFPHFLSFKAFAAVNSKGEAALVTEPKIVKLEV